MAETYLRRSSIKALERRALLSSSAGIQGIIFNDLSGDGLRQSDEPAVDGASVYLDLNHNGKRDTNEPIAVSSGAGAFSFLNLSPGTYQLRLILPGNWEGTNSASLLDVQVRAGHRTSVLVGERQLGATTLASDGILYVTGTEGNDTISLNIFADSDVADGFADISINGVAQTINNALLTKIVVHGLGGSDIISETGARYGGNIPSFLYGDAGNDSITDLVNGFGSGDSLDGGAGNSGDRTNYINGSGGNDLIIPGADAINHISGGAGTNSVDYTQRTGNLSIYLDGSKPSTDSAYPAEQDSFDGTIQRVFGGSGNDLIVAGKAGGDALFGFAGNDTLVAQGGTDALWGGDGNDLLEAKDGGRTYVDGGAGDNSAVVDKLLDTVKNLQTINY
jgi:Ca2+-binding RTX toxin-like protein